jgi:hypothetical protein
MQEHEIAGAGRSRGWAAQLAWTDARVQQASVTIAASGVRESNVRAVTVAGAILMAVGLFLIVKPQTYPHEERVFKVGEIEAKLQERRTVPGWVGGALLGAGCVLVIAGLKKS